MTDRYYPLPENVGENCAFWRNNQCTFPKVELQGRTSCEGVIDPPCIYVKDGIVLPQLTLTEEQMRDLKTKPVDSRTIPPGNNVDFSEL